ncbi:hypothetical protein Patl1_30270 [Pistacia atlantica]|uniref:Uncharacterized protein n=1 Tax=Pistacia atlantica TaxID=434234 RepID=A0ACC1A6S8_9ROSI|nr:hypothetical protein Patl1_30270 [Pistacia atlantica]
MFRVNARRAVIKEGEAREVDVVTQVICVLSEHRHCYASDRCASEAFLHLIVRPSRVQHRGWLRGNQGTQADPPTPEVMLKSELIFSYFSPVFNFEATLEHHQESERLRAALVSIRESRTKDKAELY